MQLWVRDRCAEKRWETLGTDRTEKVPFAVTKEDVLCLIELICIGTFQNLTSCYWKYILQSNLAGNQRSKKKHLQPAHAKWRKGGIKGYGAILNVYDMQIILQELILRQKRWKGAKKSSTRQKNFSPCLKEAQLCTPMLTHIPCHLWGICCALR